MATEQNGAVRGELERLQLRVTNFSVVEQRLIDTRFLLDQEIMRFGRMQVFNDLALKSALDPTFANLVAESLVDIFEVEVGIFFMGAEKNHKASLYQIAGSNLASSQVELLCSKLLISMECSTHNISARVMPSDVLETVQDILPLENALVVIVRDEKQHPPILLVAGNTVSGAPFREQFAEGHREALGLFAQQVVAHLVNLRGQQSIFEAMQEGFAVHKIIVDDAGHPVDYRFLAINPAYARIFGVGPEIIGKTAREVTPGPIDEYWLKRYGDVVRTGEPISFEGFNAALGLWLQAHVFSNAPGHFSAFFEDITERKRTEEATLTTQKLESLGIMAGGIAHDFNNMLTGIMGNTSLLLEDYQKNGESVELLGEIREACQNAKGLTHQLLTFASGGEPILQDTDLLSIVQKATTFAARGSSVKCCLDLPEGQLFARIDKNQITQVLQNLVINGIQAMSSGGTITATVRRKQLWTNDVPHLKPGSYLRVSVQDQGSGIFESTIPKVFLPYFTTKANGRGLGLSVCHSIVTKHGGAMEINSKQVQGATFTFYLPEVIPPRLSLPPETPQAACAGKRILVMDDDPAVSKLLERMLGRLGCLVEAVPDGREALASWKRSREAGEHFHLLIMDLTVPGGMGGEEAIGHFIELDPGVKAVVSSGYANGRVMADYEVYGFTGILAKPYKMEDLTALMSGIFGASKNQTGF